MVDNEVGSIKSSWMTVNHKHSFKQKLIL